MVASTSDALARRVSTAADTVQGCSDSQLASSSQLSAASAGIADDENSSEVWDAFSSNPSYRSMS